MRLYLTRRQILLDADQPSRYISRASAKHLVDKMTGCFEARSVVCLHMFNDILYIPMFLAIIASRATWTGTNPAYTVHELSNHLNRTKARYLVVEQRHLEIALEATLGRGTCVSIIVFEDVLGKIVPAVLSVPGGTRPEVISLSRFIARGRPAHEAEQPPPASHDIFSVLMSTSGTTGSPKLACRTQRALMAESAAMADGLNNKPYPVRRLFCTPIFHAFSLVLMAVNALRFGHQTYVMKRFDDTFAQKVHRLQITETAVTPAILHKLAIPGKVQRGELDSLRLIWCGGALLSSDVRHRAFELLRKETRIVQMWGMTEGGCFTTFHHPEDNHDGSVGRLLGGWTMKVQADAEGYDQSAVTKGELYVRGPQLMTEYHDDPVATREAFDCGWFKTGDVGYIQEGKVYLIDRAKNMIKVNGFQVAPAELESVIVGHPKVADCAVIRGGSGLSEHPLVFLAPTGPGLSETDMREYMLRFLTRYKVFHCRMRFVKQIQRGETGKVLTHKLRVEGHA
jgi:long-subunit acyl-CoA synthetase (AMP-forming)